MSERYETIGRSYAATRREDPRIARRIHEALGDARSVVNVGAGTGSYEPEDRYVIAVEPSDVMAEQRPPSRVPAIRASAGELPLRDRSVDAAMAILTLHHWDDAQERGVRELRRVARDRVVILTYDASVSGRMWLMADYLPEVAALDERIFPSPDALAGWLGGAWTCSRFRSPATPATGCSARSGRTPSGCSTSARVRTRRASRACRTMWCSGSSARCAATSRTAAGTRATASCETLDEHDVGLRLIVARRAG